MKKIIHFCTAIILLSTVIQCSSSDGGASSGLSQKIIGKWYFQPIGSTPNNSFTFNANHTVRYSFWDGNGTNPYTYDYEDGSWSMQDSKLTMTFPQTVSLTFVQNVLFSSNSVMQFVPTGNPSEEAYDGIYYKAP
ncbi:MAG: hypothetical protein RL427_293 [Bacteroidota bacterium]|jgi:hypothetical protein